eukprot:jgi/Ulvmu1/11190/UM072_0026.1
MIVRVFVLLLLACLAQAKTFSDGEFVSVARRAQFSQVRTEWHDMLGRHCPRFGRNSVVVLPLQRPKRWSATDDYKLMLSFDSDRLYTAWLPIIRAQKRRVPHLRVTFTTVGAEVRSVATSISELEGAFLQRHLRLVSEFDDPEAWPKHLVIEYAWEQYSDTNAAGGLVAVLLTSAVVSVLLVMTAKLRYGGDKVDRSLYELVAAIDGSNAAPPPPAADGPPSAHRASAGLPPRPPVPPPPLKRGSHVE